MQVLGQMHDQQLMQELKDKSASERKLTVEIIELLEEVDRRSLHLARGYGGLLEFCIRELHYSESAAYRRIAAMRVSQDLPQVKKSLEDGSLNLATVTQAQTFFRQEKKYRAKSYSRHEKMAVLKSLENKSKREAEKILIQKSPELPKQEFVREISESQTRIAITLDEATIEKLQQIKTLLTHKNPNPSFAELIDMMADRLLSKENKKMQADSSEQLLATMPGKVHRIATPPAVVSRYIPQSVRRFIFQRDKNCCSYSDPETSKKCSSKFQLEIDHIRPYSMGGSNEVENLRLVCGNHNQFLWREM